MTDAEKYYFSIDNSSKLTQFFKNPLQEIMMWPKSSQVRELTNAPTAGEVCNHGHRDGGRIHFHEKKTRQEHYFNSHSRQTNLSSKLVYRATPFPNSTFLHDQKEIIHVERVTQGLSERLKEKEREKQRDCERCLRGRLDSYFISAIGAPSEQQPSISRVLFNHLLLYYLSLFCN